MYIFIDESGDLCGKQSEFFVVGGFITNDPRRTARVFRKWRKTKFTNKKLRYRTELKFSDTRLAEEMRLKTLGNLAQSDIRIFYVFFKVKNIPENYHNKKGVETGLLYTEIVEQALRFLLPTGDLEFRVYRDFRQLKGVSQAKFNELLKIGLSPNLSKKAVVQLEAVNSANNTNIQIADWICGALFRYYNKGKNGDRYFSLFKNSIVVAEELFKDYWENFAKNKKSPFK
ncbi:MAG: DUF3800 domain-containing protein [Candidatus Gribaldobacteria bacterium]|nr:DUF3800 domain-containing protein [Candidatus Gribaldobacteria bacterium]